MSPPTRRARRRAVADPETIIDRSDDVGAEILLGGLELTHLMNSALTHAGAGDVTSNSDVIVLSTLRLDGPQRNRDLVAATKLTSGGVTNLVDRLVSAGFVRRTRFAEGDGRAVAIELTADGVAVVDRIATSVHEVLRLATPLLERWHELFLADGREVGSLPPHARQPRRELERLRRIGAAGRVMGPVYEEVLGAEDTTPHLTVHVLFLASRPGGVRPRKIGQMMHLKSATTTDLLDRIEARGLIGRMGSSSDGRAVVVIATDAGRRVVEAMTERSGSVVGILESAFFLD